MIELLLELLGSFGVSTTSEFWSSFSAEKVLNALREFPIYRAHENIKRRFDLSLNLN